MQPSEPSLEKINLNNRDQRTYKGEENAPTAKGSPLRKLCTSLNLKSPSYGSNVAPSGRLFMYFSMSSQSGCPLPVCGSSNSVFFIAGTVHFLPYDPTWLTV